MSSHSPRHRLNAVAMLLPLIGCLGSIAARAVNGGHPGAIPAQHPPKTFIHIKNGTLYGTDGNPTYLVGMNYWGAMNLAASTEAGGNISRFQTEVRQMAKAGINNVRIMAASEASQFGIQPFRMYPALMESPGVYNEPIFKGLDRSIAEFAKYNISVVLTLQNYWEWSGGFPQYVSWATNTTIPYPLHRWDPYLNPPYGNWTTNGTRGAYDPVAGNYTGFLGYSGRFYNDTSIYNVTQGWYRDHIRTLADRVNTVTGIKYKDDPSIMTFEYANEPQDPPLKWIEETGAFIREVAPNHLITVGFEGKQGEWWWKRVHKPDVIDYACGHLWVENWGWYNSTDPSPANLRNATSFATTFLANLTRWGQDIGKPIVLEEFGMARNNWENIEKGAPTNFYLYDASAATSNKDVYFQHVISTVVEYFKQGAGWIGTAPWAYGGIWRPFNARNQYNEEWAGDPPHEAPGWYDLYDTDYAMQIVAAQAANVTAFLAGRKGLNGHGSAVIG